MRGARPHTVSILATVRDGAGFKQPKIHDNYPNYPDCMETLYKDWPLTETSKMITREGELKGKWGQSVEIKRENGGFEDGGGR